MTDTAEVRVEQADLPLTIEFAIAYLDGALEDEHPEILKNWRKVRDFTKSRALESSLREPGEREAFLSGWNAAQTGYSGSENGRQEALRAFGINPSLFCDPCSACDGSGYYDQAGDDGEPARCGSCDGSGNAPFAATAIRSARPVEGEGE